MGAPAARADELSRHWERMGHGVTVLTGFPNHPTGIVPELWRTRLRELHHEETIGGVRVVRTWLWPLPNRKAHERIRNYLSFCISAGMRGLALSKPDVVIATSPQLLCALAGWWIAFWKRVPFVFEVRDLWPESLAAVGVGGEKTLLHRVLSVIAGFLYRRADRIVVVSPAFKDHLVRYWNIPADVISIVENGVETELFCFNPQAARAVRDRLRVENRFMICYIGTLGNAHGLDTLLAAAEKMQAVMPNAMFLLLGEGAEKQRLIEIAATRNLANVKFLDQQPREEIPAYISAADLCLVILKKTELFKTVIPTKLLEYMSCQRPVIVAVDGQARRIVEEADGGVFVDPENPQALVEAILKLARNNELRAQMGTSGRRYIINKFSREKTARDYIAVLEKL